MALVIPVIIALLAAIQIYIRTPYKSLSEVMDRRHVTSIFDFHRDVFPLAGVNVSRVVAFCCADLFSLVCSIKTPHVLTSRVQVMYKILS